MKKKFIIILIIVLFIFTGGFLFIKFYYLKAKDFSADASKEKSILDLRPSVIAKLQQLVKDGSNGLYILSIEKIDPDLISSKLDVINASIHIDSTVMLQLDSQKKLPDDIFTIHFDSLHIDGIGIADLLHQTRVDITGIHISTPLIEVFHKTRAYNKEERAHNDSLSLYQRIKGQLSKISIGHINIDNGTFIDHDMAHPKTVTKFKDVTIRINDLLIDSSTQFDANRFLFAKQATIEAGNYISATPDSLYYFKAGAISISAAQHQITLLNISLDPRFSREQFESKSHYRKEMYQIQVPKITLNDIDWWAMMNREKFIAKEAAIAGGVFKIFLDRSLPSNPAIQINNFPQQLLMKIPIPVSVNNLALKNVNISYEEYNPDAKKGAVVYFDNINARLNNASNIMTEMKKDPIADFSGSCLFMHHIPMNAKLSLDLINYKSGKFTADLHMGTLDNLIINPVAEALGLVSIKSGEMQEGTAHISGSNLNTKCKLAISYTGLKISLLKKTDENGQVKKKHLTDFIANTFLIKKENPAEGKELRQPDFSMERGHHRNFFSTIWVTITTGFLKTIGAPVKFAKL